MTCFYKKLETRYKKQEGEAPAAPILACIVGLFSFNPCCGLVAHVGYIINFEYIQISNYLAA
jgi:hypothetical protein